MFADMALMIQRYSAQKQPANPLFYAIRIYKAEEQKSQDRAKAAIRKFS